MDSLKSQCLRLFKNTNMSDSVVSTCCSMYGMLLVCIYASFVYTELVKFPTLNYWLEIHGFFIYMYLLSIAYLIYLLLFVLSGSNEQSHVNTRLKVTENLEVSYNNII